MSIQIPKGETIVECEVHGLSPLLQHRFGGENDISMKTPSAIPVASTDYSKEYLEYLYVDDKGRNCVPSTHLEASMTNAANNFKIPGHKGKRYRDRVKAFVIVEPNLIPIEPQTYHVDSRPVVVNRSRVLRLRPCFPDWRINFYVNILDSEAMPPEDTHQILEFAGRYVGIGDNRPKFGRFEVTKYQVK